METVQLSKSKLMGQSAVISIIVALFSILTFIVWFDINITISDYLLGIVIVSILFAGVGVVSSYLGNNMWRK